MSAATKFIRDGALAVDDWTALADDAALPASGKVIVGLARLRKERETLLASPLQVGVHIANTEDIAALWPDIGERPLIAIEFPKWGDGRAFSQARVLRERFGYCGELRAVGEVLRDQLQFMQRCGVNAFALREDQDAEACVASLEVFDLAYQHAADKLPNVWEARRARASSPA